MSFIHDYVTFTANTESPPDYHKWCCLSSLSVLAGRRFWFRLGPITYYPNLYVVLVGHPGVKKSSALDRSKDLIRTVGCCPIAAAQATKEYIARAMSHEKFPGKRYFKDNGVMVEYNQYAIFATELTQFIGVNPLSMLDFLTTVYTEKVYDCDTKGQGSDLVVGPYITLLACLTPEMMKGYIKMNILTGGFARRTIFVYGSPGAIVPFPEFTKDMMDAQTRLIDYGKQLQAQNGEFLMDEAGKLWYENWYTELHKNITEIAKPSTEGYYRTRHEILFKAGMLVSLSESLTNRTLSSTHFALVENQFLKPYEKNLERVFEGAGINPNAGAAAQICRMLEALDKPMPRKTLESLFYDQVTSLSDLRDTISHLVSVGRLKERTISIEGRLLGSALGTPAAMTKFTDSQIAKILLGEPPDENQT